MRLLAHDPARHALLLERCRPGAHLADSGPEVAFEVLAELLPQLWKPAGPPFRSLREEAEWWAGYLRRRSIDRELLDAALAAIEELAPTQGEQVLLHQDLHGDNVLAAERQAWLVIDPKPLSGEREFALAPIIRSRELGHGEQEVIGRLDTLAATLGLDRERARKWSLAQTVAWAPEGESGGRHLQTARWLLEAGR